MTALQICTLAVVAIAGTAVAVVASPLRQTLLLSVYGFALTVLFFVFQAADVALSELVVGGVALPLIILAALRRLADQHPGRSPGADEGSDRGASKR